MTCPPVEIGTQLKTDLETARDADEFSNSDFEVRVSLGDFPEKVEDEDLDGSRLSPHPLVDIILPVNPAFALSGRPRYTHEFTYRVGLRQKLSAGHCKRDGSFDLDQVAPLLNLFYELLAWFFPDLSDETGSITRTVNWHAIFQPPATIVKLWNPDLLESEKQYCGMFDVTCQVVEAA